MIQVKNVFFAYSGKIGQKQRVAIATALAADRDILQGLN